VLGDELEVMVFKAPIVRLDAMRRPAGSKLPSMIGRPDVAAKASMSAAWSASSGRSGRFRKLWHGTVTTPKERSNPVAGLSPNPGELGSMGSGSGLVLRVSTRRSDSDWSFCQFDNSLITEARKAGQGREAVSGSERSLDVPEHFRTMVIGLAEVRS
jgi:hypothetical protein